MCLLCVSLLCISSVWSHMCVCVSSVCIFSASPLCGPQCVCLSLLCVCISSVYVSSFELTVQQSLSSSPLPPSPHTSPFPYLREHMPQTGGKSDRNQVHPKCQQMTPQVKEREIPERGNGEEGWRGGTIKLTSHWTWMSLSVVIRILFGAATPRPSPNTPKTFFRKQRGLKGTVKIALTHSPIGVHNAGYLCAGAEGVVGGKPKQPISWQSWHGFSLSRS